MLDLVLGLEFAARRTQTQFTTEPRPKAIAAERGRREGGRPRRRIFGALSRQPTSTTQKRLPSGSARMT